MAQLEVGREYNLTHTRKGQAVVKLLREANGMVEVEIVSGVLRNISIESDNIGPGDRAEFLRTLCTFRRVRPRSQRPAYQAYGAHRSHRKGVAKKVRRGV